MTNERKILVYGASGYTGKLISESLAKRGLPFYAAGRNSSRLADEMKIVETRLSQKFDVEIIETTNEVEALTSLFEKVDVVINAVGPFMQLGKPVVKACLQTNTHYIDTTGEQDWTRHLKEEYGAQFFEKGLLLSPACSYMWCAGALAAEYVLETEGIDSLNILYQVDNALPSEASTKSFLRMVCHDISQCYLEQGALKPWPNNECYAVHAPYRARVMKGHPWGGGCEPLWFMDDDRVRNCSVLVGFGDEMIDNVMQAIDAYNELAPGLSQEEREELTNTMGEKMDTGEPDKDDLDIQRSVITCRGQGRQKTTEFIFNVSAPYQFTGEICADAATRLLAGGLIRPGFASAPQAFGHRKLLKTFAELGFTTAIPD